MSKTTFEDAFAGDIALSPLTNSGEELTAELRQLRQHQFRNWLANDIYGQVPPPPDQISVSGEEFAGNSTFRLSIKMSVADRQFEVDAALWLPPGKAGPFPLVCGLDFLGPLGIFSAPEYPIDPNARVSSRPIYGGKRNMLEETMRGVGASRWPIDLLHSAGFAVLVSCYGSWVPDDVSCWNTYGVAPLLEQDLDSAPGAISLWAWSIHRLLDAAATIDRIDMTKVSVAGHSRLGKAALWAAANDTRIGAVLANNSGCGGAAPKAHLMGETLSQLRERFPHWILPAHDREPDEPSLDQHHLLSLIAPRALYLAQAQDDLWADPMGSYMAVQEASRFWTDQTGDHPPWPALTDIWQTCCGVKRGAVGYHLRPGGHDILPYDWRQFLEFLASLGWQDSQKGSHDAARTRSIK